MPSVASPPDMCWTLPKRAVEIRNIWVDNDGTVVLCLWALGSYDEPILMTCMLRHIRVVPAKPDTQGARWRSFCEAWAPTWFQLW